MDIIIFGIALAFMGMGMVALIKPASIGTYFDVQFESVNSRNEVRAVYGGFGIAMSLALLLATHHTEWREGILVCVALALAGMAAGRLLSAMVERPGFWSWFYLGVESLGAGLLFYAL